jgi:hypothetical protein
MGYACVCVCIVHTLHIYIYIYGMDKIMETVMIDTYRIFSNLIRTPFYSFRGLKIQMRIRFAVESWILEK